eukprot:sb/3463075/
MEGKFITLFEFLLSRGIQEGCEVYCRILLRFRSQPRSPEDISKTSHSIESSAYNHYLLKHFTCSDIQRLLKDYDVLVKLPNSNLLRFDQEKVSVPQKLPFLLPFSALKSNKWANKRCPLSDRMEKFSRLRGESQAGYLSDVVFEGILDQEKYDKLYVIRALTMIYSRAKKLNFESLLPAPPTSINSVIDCELTSKQIGHFISQVTILLLPKSFIPVSFRRKLIKGLNGLIAGKRKQDFLHQLPAPLKSCSLSSLPPLALTACLHTICTEIIVPLISSRVCIIGKSKSTRFFHRDPYTRHIDERYHDYIELVRPKPPKFEVYGVYPVVLRPKRGISGGLRMISQLNKKIGDNGIPLNVLLTPLHAILKSVHSGMRERWNISPIKGRIDLKTKITNFKTQMKGCPLYYCIVDAESCYDNMNLSLLSGEVLENLHMSDWYHVIKVRVQEHHSDRTRLESFAIPSAGSTAVSLETALAHLPKHLSHCTVSFVKQSSFSAKYAKDWLRKFLLRSAAVFRGQLFIRKKGIPQGATISKILADLYFGYLFRHVNLGERESLFLSATDDILLVSTEQSVVDVFYKDCREGRFEFVVKKEKTHSYEERSGGIIKFYGLEFDLSTN